MQTLKYYGGKRNLIFQVKRGQVFRGADDGEGFGWIVEKSFYPANVSGIDWGPKAVIVVAVPGQIWQRRWDAGQAKGVWTILRNEGAS